MALGWTKRGTTYTRYLSEVEVRPADYNDLINKPDLSKYESAPALNVPSTINVDYGQIDVIGAKPHGTQPNYC